MAEPSYVAFTLAKGDTTTILQLAKKFDLDTSDYYNRDTTIYFAEVYSEFDDFIAELKNQGIAYEYKEECVDEVFYHCRRYTEKGEALDGVSEAEDLPAELIKLYERVSDPAVTLENLKEYILERCAQYAAFPLNEQQAINGKRYLMRQAVTPK